MKFAHSGVYSILHKQNQPQQEFAHSNKNAIVQLQLHVESFDVVGRKIVRLCVTDRCLHWNLFDNFYDTFHTSIQLLCFFSKSKRAAELSINWFIIVYTIWWWWWWLITFGVYHITIELNDVNVTCFRARFYLLLDIWSILNDFILLSQCLL